ncbi:MAG: nuclear transport factor 2 family protein [Casimicrobiaceae bacterium]
MSTENQSMAVENDAKELVLSFIRALNEEDFEAAGKCLSDDMQFVGVMGTRDGREAYINDMIKMKLKYNIQKIFADREDVCLFYDINMGGITIFSCGWYKIVDSKIKSFKVIFDPRPLLDKK